MADTDKMPTVRQHADAMIDKLIAERPPTVDLDAARQAAAVPTFSSGTAALDGNGKPILPKGSNKVPEFTEGSVAIPEGSETQGGTPTGHSKEELLAAHQARVDARNPPAEAAAVAPPAESVAGQAEASASAEAAAEAIADRFADAEDFDWQDPDLDISIPIRVPKQYVETVKRGYGRRAALDRAIRYAKEADPTLRPLIEDGRLARLMPLIQDALNDPDGFGDYVYKGYQRKQQGLPLIEQAKLEAAAPVNAPVDPLAEFGMDGDPFLAEQLRPMQQRYEQLEQRFQRQDQEREQAARTQRETQQRNERMANEMQLAHRDLAAAYPQQFDLSRGAQDPAWIRAVAQAKEARYTDAYGIRAGVVFGGQMAMQIEQERIAATGSPTADALRLAESQHGELARREAAAASRAVGGGSATPAPRPAPLPAPTPRRADGSLKNPDEFLRDQQAYMASVR